jgi:hypothetical protein
MARAGINVLILVDPINNESLRGTKLQGTLLRARRSLGNLAAYEGAMLRLACASGKQCPRCGLRWDRDKGALYNLAYAYFARMAKEECDDYTAMAAGVLEAMSEWLAKHQNALTR